MADSFLLFSVFFILFNLSATDTSVYDSFLNCFEHNTNPQDHISDLVFYQTNTSYSSVLRDYIRNSRFNTSTTPKPQIIITPTKITHVQAAVLCTKKLGGYLLKIRSGGHDFEGISYVSNSPFFVLDMFNLRSIEIDVKNESAWVQSGATLGEVYYAIWEKSRVHGFPAGVCPTVGIGGHVSGGGYGNMMRKYGLTVDNVVDAQIVDVNGKILDRNGMGEDLFWAIKGGGGGSFGVVVSYKIKLVAVPETVTVFKVAKTVEENGTDLVYQWQLVAPKTDTNLFMRLVLQPMENTVRATVMALYLGNAESVVSLLGKEFPQLGLKKENCAELSWIQSALWWASLGTNDVSAILDRKLDTAKFGKRKSDYVENPISKNGLDSIWRKMVELGETGLVFNPYGGRMSEISASETPFPHRAGNLFKIQYSISWKEEGKEAEDKYLSQVRELHRFMTPYVSKNPRRAFLCYRDLDIGVMSGGKDSYEEGRVYGVKYFGGNFDRLVKVKTDADPTNFFRNEQSIPTLPTYSPATAAASRRYSDLLLQMIAAVIVFWTY